MFALAGLAATAWLTRGMSPGERRIAWLAWMLRPLAVWLNLFVVTVVYAQGGDILGYQLLASRYAEMLSIDFERTSWLLLRALVRLRGEENIISGGSSTGVMIAFASWMEWLVGHAKLSCGMLFTMTTHAGLLVLHRELRPTIPPRLRVRTIALITLVPSVVYWSSALLKEPAVLGFVAATIAFIFRWLRTKRPTALAAAGLAAVPVWLIKPYLLPPLLLAGAVATLLARVRTRRRLRFGFGLVARTALGLALGLWLVILILPDWSPFQVIEDAQRLQEIGARQQRGSQYQVGGGFSREGLFWVVPATLTALMRPFPGEVLNVQGLAASLEIFVFVVGAFIAIRRHGVRRLGQAAADEPWIAFCVLFLLLGAVGVGIASSNYGTLSRYRMPVMPAYALLVFVVPAMLTERARSARNRRGHALDSLNAGRTAAYSVRATDASTRSGPASVPSVTRAS